MPRFSVKIVLIAFAVVALWLSSFTRYVGADDVRRSILMLILCGTTAMALWSAGRRRAFWLGFLFVMGMYFHNNADRFVPQFNWVYGFTTTMETTLPVEDPFGEPPGDPLFGPPITPPPPVLPMQAEIETMAIETARTIGMLLLAVVSGWVSASIYARIRAAATD